MYFLLVALSQFVPVLRLGFLFTYVAPLVFVLAITIGKEAIDDFKRYLRDKEANGQKYMRLTTGGLVPIPSSDIKVGQLIQIETNQRVPCDMILLRTTEKSGASFIRTDQLDGETDWKLRRSVTLTQKMQADQELLAVKASIYAEKPKKDIYSFIGTLTQKGGAKPEVEPLSVENTLWANTVVASGTVIGVPIYTGREMRAVMNTSQPSTKVGLIDVELNNLSKILFVLLLVLSIVMTLLRGLRGLWYVYFFRFLLLLSAIIPISLRVSLDMGKTVYSVQMMRDEEIPNTVVRSSTIPEELGRIEYLLSDKTGTLTQNDMVFKKLHLGTVAFTQDTLDELETHLEQSFDPNHVSAGEGKVRRTITTRVKVAITAIALCHNVTPVIEEGQPEPEEPKKHHLADHLHWPHLKGKDKDKDKGKGKAKAESEHQKLLEDDGEYDQESTEYKKSKRLPKRRDDDDASDDDEDEDAGKAPRENRPGAQNVTYQASSPDEVALVKFTESVGLALADRTMTSMTLRDPHGALSEYDVLAVFPFTSETKRMGIIVRDKASGEITFYMKGADVVMAKIVADNDWLEEECGNMAREGLRTLVFGRRLMSQEEYQRFQDTYNEAKATIHNRAGNVAQALATIEHGLELVALSGVEDKLQPHVRATLEMLRNAGIKVWMLTGDKIETATCIAISTRLVSRTQSLFTVSGGNQGQIVERLKQFEQMRDACLVIDGSSLQLCLDNFKDIFIRVACKAPSVVCCRCSPTQKAEIVKLIGVTTKKRTCAVGDGGNDVSMIQAAHVGVGLEGKEGKQASLAADFSITQFSFLARLILWHGRNSYKRSARLSQFVIHRGLIISFIQAVFSAIFFFAAISIYNGFLLVGYATIYTMAPVFSLVLDEDVSEHIAMRYPELYHELQKGRALSYKTFFVWVLKSVYQGGAIMLLAIALFESSLNNVVAITFTSLVLCELLNVAFEINTWHRYMVAAEICTVVIYVASMMVPGITSFEISFILSLDFIWKVLVITAVSCLPLYLGGYIKRKLDPPSYTKLQ
eukprot:TRINITY_DN3524_c0_g1_i3.p1 TRINITY_DN3524_c0_g1~~TRINITY_DN3524_c0_g1_i3.p1  ORF type:complete len:1185 (-),score=348.75 TRINITY_DN3524_c0_g1_i3:5-3115(-)